MRRSSFIRATFERPERRFPSPIPDGQWRVGVPVSEAENSVPKSEPIRSDKYRRWIASQPCALCKAEGYSQAAHANMGKGMGIKACDSLLFPACGPRGLNIGCHQRIDLSVDMTRDERRALESRLVQETQRLAVLDGWDLKTLTRKA